MRKIEKKRKGKAIFKKTARATNLKNVSTSVPRGGIRL